MRTALRWLIPAVLVVGWLVIGGMLGPYAGKMGEVESNDAAAFLPHGAESTQVQQIQRQFSDTDAVPVIVVWESSSAITAQQRRAAAGALRAVAGIPAVSGRVSPPLPSPDGRALRAVVPLSGDAVASDDDPVGGVRAQVRLPGLRSYVTGPAAIRADLLGAFSGIDGVLLFAALGVVLVILVVVYRSLLLPVIVLLSAVFALGAACAAVYVLADSGAIALNGQSQGILSILVIGAATDYALLLVARFREEIVTAGRFAAVRTALRHSAPPIAASAATVAVSLLCLLFSDYEANRALGPVGAIGIACALIAALTFLPAVLALLGRAAFWPVRPKPSTGSGWWDRLAAVIGRRPRMLWLGSVVGLLILAAFLPTLRADGTSQSEVFLNSEPSVAGQQALDRHFSTSGADPAVIIADAAAATRVADAAGGVSGVTDARVVTEPGGRAPKVLDGRVQINAPLSGNPDSDAAIDTVRRLRTAVHGVTDGHALVGGYTATQADTRSTGERDRAVVIPIVLAVVLVILVLLLRSVLAPVLLVASVALSFAATLGVAALVFNHVWDFPGADPSVPLYGFVFLVALGVDYNIFLVTRAREEAARLGTREGIRSALVSTGPVITSAGIVLAATFSALVVIPLLFLAQVAFIVAFGVLLDTLVVRSVLVPALIHDIGTPTWWPTRGPKPVRQPPAMEPAAGPPST